MSQLNVAKACALGAGAAWLQRCNESHTGLNMGGKLASTTFLSFQHFAFQMFPTRRHMQAIKGR